MQQWSTSDFSMEQVVGCLRLPVLSPVIRTSYQPLDRNWRMRWSSSASWSISPRHVGRLLQEAQLKPHQIRYWFPPDEEFDAKVSDIAA